jgi:hypothetical protein
MSVIRDGRSLIFTMLPRMVAGVDMEGRGVQDMEVVVMYAGTSNCWKGIMLDNFIMPAILAGLVGQSAVEKVKAHLRNYLDQPGEVTPTALAEVCLELLEGRSQP